MATQIRRFEVARGSKSNGPRRPAVERLGRSREPTRRAVRPAEGSAVESERDKSVEAFRDALERSVTLSRDRLQEVVDDAVGRGRMTRDDANELVSNLVTRGRSYSDDLVKELERLLDQARQELDSRTAPARRRATAAAGRAARAARDAADAPLAQADRIRRRAGVSAGGPITAYDQLTAPQVKARLETSARPSCARSARARSAARRERASWPTIERRLK